MIHAVCLLFLFQVNVSLLNIIASYQGSQQKLMFTKFCANLPAYSTNILQFSIKMNFAEAKANNLQFCTKRITQNVETLKKNSKKHFLLFSANSMLQFCYLNDGYCWHSTCNLTFHDIQFLCRFGSKSLCITICLEFNLSFFRMFHQKHI